MCVAIVCSTTGMGYKTRYQHPCENPWITCCGDGVNVLAVLGERYVPREGHPVYLCQLGSLRKTSDEQTGRCEQPH